MPTSHARFETPNGSKYLQQLCKHFGHKTEVEFDAEKGRIALSPGPAELRADAGGLDVTVSAEDDESLARLRGIVESHLKRFAFREEFETLDWS